MQPYLSLAIALYYLDDQLLARHLLLKLLRIGYLLETMFSGFQVFAYIRIRQLQDSNLVQQAKKLECFLCAMQCLLNFQGPSHTR